MSASWEVIGGADSGGIFVREGKDLKSPAAAERLSTGAIVEEIALVGERLNYKLVTGTGPPTGWVSLKIKAANLLVKREAVPEVALGPGEYAEVEVDEALKKKIEAAHKVKKDGDAFPNYVMKYKLLGCPLPEPKLRVLCFHPAGSAESVFTAKGSGFIEWAKETKSVEVCALDYPGRDKLLRADKISAANALAEDLMAVFYEKMTDGVPYIIWGHSVGTWVSFEFVVLARKLGLPMPIAAFWNAFPAPHMPEGMRKWHKNKGLNEKQFKEEVQNWDREHFGGAASVVFEPVEWVKTWMPLMRSDFSMFDEYKFMHNGFPKFPFPIHAWHFDGEHFNTPDMIEMWKDWTTEAFDFQIFKGMNHLTCCYKPEQKAEVFGKVTDLLKKYFSGL